VPYLSASAVVIHYEEALYQQYALYLYYCFRLFFNWPVFPENTPG